MSGGLLALEVMLFDRSVDADPEAPLATSLLAVEEEDVLVRVGAGRPNGPKTPPREVLEADPLAVKLLTKEVKNGTVLVLLKVLLLEVCNSVPLLVIMF